MAWFSDPYKCMTACAIVLYFFQSIHAKNTWGTQNKSNKAAYHTCYPNSCSIMYFHSGEPIITTVITANYHRHMTVSTNYSLFMAMMVTVMMSMMVITIFLSLNYYAFLYLIWLIWRDICRRWLLLVLARRWHNYDRLI
jgi:hypothetical protein